MLSASIIYSAPYDAASGVISPGTCLIPLASGVFVPATAANFAASGATSVYGVSLDYAATVPGAVRIQIDGIIPASISGLGPGSTGNVGPNPATGALERSTGSTGPACGTVINTNGDVRLNAAVISGGQGNTATASGTVTSGNAVVSVPTDSTRMQQFTIAAVLAGAVVVGIATSTSTGGTFTYAPLNSVVSRTVTGLPSSTTAGSRVGISATGSLSVISASYSGFEIGTVDSAGNVTVDPSSPTRQASLLPFNPSAYGAIPNDSSGAAQTANLVAFNTMMGDIRRRYPYGHKVAISDKFYLADTWYIDSPISLECSGGNFSGGISEIVVPNQSEGIVLLYPSMAANGNANGAQGTRIRHLSVSSDLDVAIVPLWKPLTAYTRNTLVRFPDDPRYVYRCTTAGTSGATVPVAFGAPEMTAPPRWSPGATYAVGKYIQPVKSSSQYGLKAYQITSANGDTTPGAMGVAGTATPSFPGSGPVTSGELVLTAVTFDTIEVGLQAKLAIVDGSVTWMPESISGVLAHAVVDVDGMYINGFICSAIHLYGDGYKGNVDFSRIRNVVMFMTAGGISIRGIDGNGLSVSDCTVRTCGFSIRGTPLPGLIGHAFDDSGQAGSTFSGCGVETCAGRAFNTSKSGVSTFVTPVSDGNFVANGFAHNAVVFAGGDNAADYDFTSTILSPRARGGLQQQYVGVEYGGPNRLYSGFSAGDGRTLYPISGLSEAKGSAYIGWRYDNYLEGWWLRTYTLNNGPVRYIFGLSGVNERTNGPANQWDLCGRFEGSPGSNVYVGVDPSFAADKYVRYGQRVRGDIYRHNGGALAGDWTHKIASNTGGYVATSTWSAGGSPGTYNIEFNIPAETVTGAGGYAYQCVRTGVSGGANPFTAPVGNFGPVNVVEWQANVNVRPGDKFFSTTRPDPATVVVSVFQVDASVWTATTNVGPNDIIQPYSAVFPNTQNKDTFAPAVDPYNAAFQYQIGAVVQSSAKNLAVAFQLISAPSTDGTIDWPGGYSVSTTTGSEPAWNAVVGSNNTSGNGYVWKTIQLTTGSIEPTWGKVEELISVLPTQGTFGYRDNNFYWKRVQLNTGNAQPSWVIGINAITPSGTTIPFNYKRVTTFTNDCLYADGGALWMCVGPAVTWNIAGKVENDTTNFEARARYREGETPAANEQIGKVRYERQRAVLTTANATPATIDGYVIPTNCTVEVTSRVTAFNSASGGAGYTLFGVYKNVAGTVTLVGTVDKVAKEDAGMAAADVNQSISGTSVNTVVTGIAATSIAWGCVREGVEGLL